MPIYDTPGYQGPAPPDPPKPEVPPEPPGPPPPPWEEELQADWQPPRKPWTNLRPDQREL